MGDQAPADETFDSYIPNLSPAANPLTPVLVAAVERASRVGLKGMRLRDSYIEAEAGDHIVEAGLPRARLCFMLHLGGDLRGGQGSGSWAHLRAHPWYHSDEDSASIPDHAVVRFTLPRGVDEVFARCARLIPATAVTPEQKQEDAKELRESGCIRSYPSKLAPAGVQEVMVAVAMVVAGIRPAP